MCFTMARVRLSLAAVIVACCAIGASPCTAQTRVTSAEELRRVLSAGDVVIVVPAVGEPVEARLRRIGDAHLDLRVLNRRTREMGGPRDLTLPLDGIQSLERPRDSARDGAALGAGIGAGFGGALFVYAFLVDRNEIDEWAPLYGGAAAAFTGIGALIGWMIDAAHSKPHIAFERSFGRKMNVSVGPVYLRGPGIALGVSF
jgi:hypothetical protein